MSECGVDISCKFRDDKSLEEFKYLFDRFKDDFYKADDLDKIILGLSRDSGSACEEIQSLFYGYDDFYVFGYFQRVDELTLKFNLVGTTELGFLEVFPSLAKNLGVTQFFSLCYSSSNSEMFSYIYNENKTYQTFESSEGKSISDILEVLNDSGCHNDFNNIHKLFINNELMLGIGEELASTDNKSSSVTSESGSEDLSFQCFQGVRNGDVQKVKKALKEGASTDGIYAGMKLIEVAIIIGNVEVVSELLKNGVSPFNDKLGRNGDWLLAKSHGMNEAAKVIKQHGAKPSVFLYILALALRVYLIFKKGR